MITPEEAAQEEAIIEIERRFEREYLRSPAVYIAPRLNCAAS